MISRAEVDKLLDVRAAGPSLLSLYVQVPLDPAELRGLRARVGELFALAAPGLAAPETGIPRGAGRGGPWDMRGRAELDKPRSGTSRSSRTPRRSPAGARATPRPGTSGWRDLVGGAQPRPG